MDKLRKGILFDSGNLIAPDAFEPFDENEMHELADAVRPFVPTVEVRGV